MLLGLNQVAIKITNEALQPVFWAALRSFIATLLILMWVRFRGGRVRLELKFLAAGLLMSGVFSGEFVLLFVALDLTTVVRTSVIFYTMPVWLALAAHFLLPGERMTLLKAVGLAMAVCGVIWAIGFRDSSSGGSLTGDLCALGAAFGWAGIPLCARLSALRRVEPETQLIWQLTLSVPILLFASLFFGALVRDFHIFHLAPMAFQSGIVVAAGFLIWLHLLKVYSASGVASFSFLAPLFGVFMGWLLLGEPVGPSVIGSLVLVSIGIVLINKQPSTPRGKTA